MYIDSYYYVFYVHGLLTMFLILEKLKGFIILAYEELATPVGHDQCYAAVEYPFFQPLWPLLLAVLRYTNPPPLPYPI